MNPNNKIIKLTLIGETDVGKTQISNRLADKPFSENYIATIGASMVKIEYNDKETGESTWFYLWDTAGQEKYRTLAPVYFHDSDVVLIVYDVSNEESFQKLSVWYDLFNENASKFDDHCILIIGNKIDLRENEIDSNDDEQTNKKLYVETSRGREWAQEHNCDFIEVSAKTGENIGSIVEKMVEYSKMLHIHREESILNAKKAESGCC